MKSFKSLVVLKHPRARVWEALRDQLDQLSGLLDDVGTVTIQSREVLPENQVRLVNIWRADAQIPAALTSLVKPDMLAWTDTAVWNDDGFACHWIVEPHFQTKSIKCSGVTTFVETMAGRGTRVVFEGTLDITPAGLSGVPSIMRGTVSGAAEAFVTALIPRNFRRLSQAVGKYLDENT